MAKPPFKQLNFMATAGVYGQFFLVMFN